MPNETILIYAFPFTSILAAIQQSGQVISQQVVEEDHSETMDEQLEDLTSQHDSVTPMVLSGYNSDNDSILDVDLNSDIDQTLAGDLSLDTGSTLDVDLSEAITSTSTSTIASSAAITSTSTSTSTSTIAPSAAITSTSTSTIAPSAAITSTSTSTIASSAAITSTSTSTSDSDSSDIDQTSGEECDSDDGLYNTPKVPPALNSSSAGAPNIYNMPDLQLPPASQNYIEATVTVILSGHSSLPSD